MLEEEESINAIRQLTEQFDEVRFIVQNIDISIYLSMSLHA